MSKLENVETREEKTLNEIFTDYYNSYIKEHSINKRVIFKTDSIQQPENNLGCVESNDVLFKNDEDIVTIEQFNSDNTRSKAEIDLSQGLGSIKIIDDNKELECVKIVINNDKTNIDETLLGILNNGYVYNKQ